jgi:hypothetical protein
MLKANKLPTPSHCDSSRPGWHHMRAFYSMFYVEYWERFPQVSDKNHVTIPGASDSCWRSL